MTDVEVSVVLPAYNEANTIEDTVQVTLDTLASFLQRGSYEVIIAEDGCEDRTPEIADLLASENEAVRHVHSDERLGRGGALERAFRAGQGSTLIYFDTDLATDMAHLEELVESVRSEGYDVVTGSRWMPGERATRETDRKVASAGFNALVGLFLRSELNDHQCGFKAFDRGALFDLLSEVEDDHWFWDTEVLVRAQRRGYRIKEFPVDWTPEGDSTVDLVRNVFGMGSQILRVWWEFAVEPRVTRRMTTAAGTLLILAALGLMTLYLDPSSILAHIGTADTAMIGLAAAVYVVSWPFRGLRYRDILAELGYQEDVGFLTGVIFISQTANLVFPARAGDVVRAYVVKARRAIPYPTGFASLAVERILDLLTITVLAGVVLLGLAATGSTVGGLEGAPPGIRRSGRTALSVASGVGIAAVLAVAAIVASARTDTNLPRQAVTAVSDDSYAKYVSRVLEQFVGDVQAVAGNRRAFARVGASSFLIWSLDIVTALVVFVAFGIGLTPYLVAIGFFAVSVGNLAKVLPLSPGGIGLYEGAFTLIVIGLTEPAALGTSTAGAAAALALAISIVDHAVKNLVTVGGGVGSMLALNVSLVTAVERTDGIKREDDLEAIEADG